MARTKRGPGVCLVQKKGCKNWYVGVNQKGKDGKWKTKWVSTGTPDEAEARRLFFEPARELAEGRARQDRAAAVMEAAGAAKVFRGLALVDLWSWYEKHGQNQAGKTVTAVKKGRTRRLVAWMGLRHPEVRFVHEVSIRMAGEFWRHLEELELAPGTRNNWRATLAGVWKGIAVVAEQETNPWEKLLTDTGGGTNTQPLTGPQLRALVEAAKGFESREPGFWPVAIQMGMETGLREAMIATMRGRDLEWTSGFLKLKERKTKATGLTVVHSLNRPWARALPRVVGEGYLWPAAAAAAQAEGSSRWLGAEFKAICKLAGIETEREKAEGERRVRKPKLVTFHSMRHSFVTLLLEVGKVDHQTLVEQGGWANDKVLKAVYDGAKVEQAERAALKVEVALQDLNVMGE
jgi:integrase